MSGKFPKYNHTDLPEDPVNQYVYFEDILSDASKHGLVNEVPLNEEDTYKLESQRIRLQTIATRLYLLGYIKRKITPKNLGKNLELVKQAVAKFQLEANLKQDNWVGEKTWFALHQLVSFESELDYNQWFENDNIKEETKYALHRAIQLRLWSLGLYYKKPGEKIQLLQKKSLGNLKDIFNIFLIRPNRLTPDFNYNTLKVLFNQDLLTKSIIERASLKRNSFMLRLPDKNKARYRTKAQSFIVNCAKIELWLMGYDIKIDGRNDFYIDTESDIYEAIKNYYKDFCGFEEHRAYDMAKKITPKLFEGIVEVASNDDDFKEDDASYEIAIEMQSQNDIETAWSFIKERGIRLWDGLKRMWRWIVKKGKQILSYANKNIFIGFFRYISKAYKILKKGFAEVVNSIKTYINGTIQTTKVLIGFSKDMDTTVLMNNDITEEEIITANNKIQTQSQVFKVSCKIVSWVIRIFKNLVAGFYGWGKLLYTLLKSYKDIRQMYQEFKMIAQI